MIKIRLSGGIGNQLFQYFEGARKALESNKRLVLDFENIYLGKSKHSSLIGSFILPFPAEYMNTKPNAVATWFRKLKLSIIFRISKTTGISDSQQHNEALRTQTWKNYHYVLDKTKVRLELRNKSLWFSEHSELIKSEPIIAIHIRRGDYLLPRNINSIGALDTSYYFECLQLAIAEVGNAPIWVFSDSTNIEDEFRDIFPQNTRYIRPPLGADPAESIVLMSQAKVLIISNSTFSWWAACLASMESTIYSPSNWFKNLEAPKDLLMNSWRLVESKWKNQDE